MHHSGADFCFVVEVAGKHLTGIRLRNAAVDTGEVEEGGEARTSIGLLRVCQYNCAGAHRDSWSPISARVSESLSEASAAEAGQSVQQQEQQLDTTATKHTVKP